MNIQHPTSCPFCGGRCEYKPGNYTGYVMCLKCGVMGPNLPMNEAAEAWNMRFEESAQREIALKAALSAAGLKLAVYSIGSVGSMGLKVKGAAELINLISRLTTPLRFEDPTPDNNTQAVDAIMSLVAEYRAVRSESPMPEQEAYRAVLDAVTALATQPTASNAEERGSVAMEHIGTLNPDYPHRLKCKQCGSEAGQVLRAGSDVFDCLCCGFFTYVEGVNLNARAALASKPPAGEQKPVAQDHIHLAWRGALMACGVSGADLNAISEVVLSILSATPSPQAEKQPLGEEQIAVLRFLDGVGVLRGHGFGMKPPTERGNYWWRKDLRAAFPDVDFGIVTKESTNG